MNILLKVLIGVAAVGAVAATTYVVVKKTEEKKEETTQEEGTEEVVEKKETPIEKLKMKANKKLIKIFAWMMLNKNKIELAAALLSVVAGVIKVVNASRDFCTGSKLTKTVNDIYNWQGEYTEAWNSYINAQKGNVVTLNENLEHFEHILKEGV